MYYMKVLILENIVTDKKKHGIMTFFSSYCIKISAEVFHQQVTLKVI